MCRLQPLATAATVDETLIDYIKANKQVAATVLAEPESACVPGDEEVSTTLSDDVLMSEQLAKVALLQQQGQ